MATCASNQILHVSVKVFEILREIKEQLEIYQLLCYLQDFTFLTLIRLNKKKSTKEPKLMFNQL